MHWLLGRVERTGLPEVPLFRQVGTAQWVAMTRPLPPTRPASPLPGVTPSCMPTGLPAETLREFSCRFSPRLMPVQLLIFIVYDIILCEGI